MSRYKERQLSVMAPNLGKLRPVIERVEIRRVRKAEDHILRDWDAVSVCSEEDVRSLEERRPSANVVHVPNAVDRSKLPVEPSPNPRILFVGSLASLPNIQGLRAFLDEAWPRIRSTVPFVSLDVVGMMPPPGLDAKLETVAGRLHAGVPSLEPFYRDCDVVIAPIFFGGGTRIKILEAMAYGRAVVSTTIGAEGLSMEHGRHALIADDMTEFADAVIRLCRDEPLRRSIADAANALQRERFGPETIDKALRVMIDGAGKR